MIRTRSSLLLLGALASTAPAQNWLDAASLITEPKKGEAFGVGDQNGDGNADILYFDGVISSATSWTAFRTLFGDGTGRFTSGPSQSLVGTGYVPRKLPIADLDGDGIGDVVVEKNTSPFAVVVVRGTAGGGSLAPLPLSLPFRLEFIALGNNDTDSALEIATVTRTAAVGNPDYEIRWWNWNGSVFVASTSLVLPAAIIGDFGVNSIAILDANQDGFDDIAAGELFGSDIRLLMTQAGAPTLGPPIATAFSNPRPIAGDLDHDGDDDLVASTTTQVEIVQPIFQTAPRVFTPGLAIEQSALTPSVERPMFLGDWDGDGDEDLLAPSSMPGSNNVSTLALLEFDGASFDFAGRIRCGDVALGNQIGAGPADFDHDGHLDFATLNGVAFGNGRFEDVFSPITALSFVPANGRLLDWEGDGDADILRDAFGGLFLGGGPVYLNDARGTFGDPSLALPPLPGFQWGTSTFSSVVRSIGNFAGGPGPDELVVVGTISTSPFVPTVFAHMRLLVNDELGHLVDGGIATTEQMNTSSLKPVDVDANGTLDVLGTKLGNGGYWPNLGNGTFGPFVPLFTPTPVCAFDAEFDGDVDFIALTGSALIAFLRDDGATYTQIPITTASAAGIAPDLLDLDSDGDLDLVYATGSGPSGGMNLLRNDGVAGFTVVANLPSDFGVAGTYAFTEATGDGIADLVVSGPGSLLLRVLVFPGLGPAFSFGPFSRFYGNAFDFADIDQDGDIDGVGLGLVRNRTFDGPNAGYLRQYGVSSSGSGNAKPVLGGTGPVRPGSTTASLRVRLGLGGAPAFFLIGFGETSLPGFGVPGFTLQVNPLYNIIPVPLAGGPGVPGQGSFDFPTSSLIATVQGLSIFHQFAILDPAAQSGVSFTNGLEIHYGL